MFEHSLQNRKVICSVPFLASSPVDDAGEAISNLVDERCLDLGKSSGVIIRRGWVTGSLSRCLLLFGIVDVVARRSR